MKFDFYKKSVALFTILFYSFSQIVTANDAQTLSSLQRLNEIKIFSSNAWIPSDLGQVVETWGTQPKVFLIQDVHGHAEAQEKTHRLLEFLHKEKPIQKIYIEGGFGKLDPDLLRFFQKEEHNRKAAEILLKEGEIGGAETFLLKENVPAYGLEDAELYLQNLEAFRELKQHRDDIKSALTLEFQKLREKGFRFASSELKMFFKEWMRYESRQEDLLRFLTFLESQSEKKLNLNLKHPRNQLMWPNLVRFFELKKREPKLDLVQAEEERQKLFVWAKEAKIKKEWLYYLENPEEIKERRHFWESFYDQAERKGFLFEAYPHLTLFEGFKILESEIQSEHLYRELHLLRDRLLEKMIQTEKERDWIEQAKQLLWTQKLLKLELTRDEWKTALSVTAKQGAAISKYTKIALEFYELAVKRDQAMMQEFLKRHTPSSKKSSVLVAGGFHTQGFTSNLKERDIPYAVIRPTFQALSADKKYLESLLGRTSKLNPEYFQLRGLSWIVNWITLNLPIPHEVSSGRKQLIQEIQAGLNARSAQSESRTQSFLQESRGSFERWVQNVVLSMGGKLEPFLRESHVGADLAFMTDHLLVNAFDAAIRHLAENPESKTVQVSLRVSAVSKNTLRIVVEDNGTGVTRKALENIFMEGRFNSDKRKGEDQVLGLGTILFGGRGIALREVRNKTDSLVGLGMIQTSHLSILTRHASGESFLRSEILHSGENREINLHAEKSDRGTLFQMEFDLSGKSLAKPLTKDDREEILLEESWSVSLDSHLESRGKLDHSMLKSYRKQFNGWAAGAIDAVEKQLEEYRTEVTEIQLVRGIMDHMVVNGFDAAMLNFARKKGAETPAVSMGVLVLDGNRFKIVIEDNGIGMDEDTLSSLFDADKENASQKKSDEDSELGLESILYGGRGIALAALKQMVSSLVEIEKIKTSRLFILTRNAEGKSFSRTEVFHSGEEQAISATAEKEDRGTLFEIELEFTSAPQKKDTPAPGSAEILFQGTWQPTQVRSRAEARTRGVEKRRPLVEKRSSDRVEESFGIRILKWAAQNRQFVKAGILGIMALMIGLWLVFAQSDSESTSLLPAVNLEQKWNIRITGRSSPWARDAKVSNEIDKVLSATRNRERTSMIQEIQFEPWRDHKTREKGFVVTAKPKPGNALDFNPIKVRVDSDNRPDFMDLDKLQDQFYVGANFSEEEQFKNIPRVFAWVAFFVFIGASIAVTIAALLQRRGDKPQKKRRRDPGDQERVKRSFASVKEEKEPATEEEEPSYLGWDVQDESSPLVREADSANSVTVTLTPSGKGIFFHIGFALRNNPNNPREPLIVNFAVKSAKGLVEKLNELYKEHQEIFKASVNGTKIALPFGIKGEVLSFALDGNDFEEYLQISLNQAEERIWEKKMGRSESRPGFGLKTVLEPLGFKSRSESRSKEVVVPHAPRDHQNQMSWVGISDREFLHKGRERLYRKQPIESDVVETDYVGEMKKLVENAVQQFNEPKKLRNNEIFETPEVEQAVEELLLSESQEPSPDELKQLSQSHARLKSMLDKKELDELSQIDHAIKQTKDALQDLKSTLGFQHPTLAGAQEVIKGLVRNLKTLQKKSQAKRVVEAAIALIEKRVNVSEKYQGSEYSPKEMRQAAKRLREQISTIGSDKPTIFYFDLGDEEEQSGRKKDTAAHKLKQVMQLSFRRYSESFSKRFFEQFDLNDENDIKIAAFYLLMGENFIQYYHSLLEAFDYEEKNKGKFSDIFKTVFELVDFQMQNQDFVLKIIKFLNLDLWRVKRRLEGMKATDREMRAKEKERIKKLKKGLEPQLKRLDEVYPEGWEAHPKQLKGDAARDHMRQKSEDTMRAWLNPDDPEDKLPLVSEVYEELKRSGVEDPSTPTHHQVVAKKVLTRMSKDIARIHFYVEDENEALYWEKKYQDVLEYYHFVDMVGLDPIRVQGDKVYSALRSGNIEEFYFQFERLLRVDYIPSAFQEIQRGFQGIWTEEDRTLVVEGRDYLSDWLEEAIPDMLLKLQSYRRVLENADLEDNLSVLIRIQDIEARLVDVLWELKRSARFEEELTSPFAREELRNYYPVEVLGSGEIFGFRWYQKPVFDLDNPKLITEVKVRLEGVEYRASGMRDDPPVIATMDFKLVIENGEWVAKTTMEKDWPWPHLIGQKEPLYVNPVTRQTVENMRDFMALLSMRLALASGVKGGFRFDGIEKPPLAFRRNGKKGEEVRPKWIKNLDKMDVLKRPIRSMPKALKAKKASSESRKVLSIDKIVKNIRQWFAYVSLWIWVRLSRHGDRIRFRSWVPPNDPKIKKILFSAGKGDRFGFAVRRSDYLQDKSFPEYILVRFPKNASLEPPKLAPAFEFAYFLTPPIKGESRWQEHRIGGSKLRTLEDRFMLADDGKRFKKRPEEQPVKAITSLYDPYDAAFYLRAKEVFDRAFSNTRVISSQDRERMQKDMAFIGVDAKTNLLFPTNRFETFMWGMIRFSRERPNAYLTVRGFAQFDPSSPNDIDMASFLIHAAWRLKKQYEVLKDQAASDEKTYQEMTRLEKELVVESETYRERSGFNARREAWYEKDLKETENQGFILENRYQALKAQVNRIYVMDISYQEALRLQSNPEIQKLLNQIPENFQGQGVIINVVPSEETHEGIQNARREAVRLNTSLFHHYRVELVELENSATGLLQEYIGLGNIPRAIEIHKAINLLIAYLALNDSGKLPIERQAKYLRALLRYAYHDELKQALFDIRMLRLSIVNGKKLPIDPAEVTHFEAQVTGARFDAAIGRTMGDHRKMMADEANREILRTVEIDTSRLLRAITSSKSESRSGDINVDHIIWSVNEEALRSVLNQAPEEFRGALNDFIQMQRTGKRVQSRGSAYVSQGPLKVKSAGRKKIQFHITSKYALNTNQIVIHAEELEGKSKKEVASFSFGMDGKSAYTDPRFHGKSGALWSAAGYEKRFQLESILITLALYVAKVYGKREFISLENTQITHFLDLAGFRSALSGYDETKWLFDLEKTPLPPLARRIYVRPMLQRWDPLNVVRLTKKAGFESGSDIFESKILPYIHEGTAYVVLKENGVSPKPGLNQEHYGQAVGWMTFKEDLSKKRLLADQFVIHPGEYKPDIHRMFIRQIKKYLSLTKHKTVIVHFLSIDSLSVKAYQDAGFELLKQGTGSQPTVLVLRREDVKPLEPIQIRTDITVEKFDVTDIPSMIEIEKLISLKKPEEEWGWDEDAFFKFFSNKEGKPVKHYGFALRYEGQLIGFVLLKRKGGKFVLSKYRVHPLYDEKSLRDVFLRSVLGHFFKEAGEYEVLVRDNDFEVQSYLKNAKVNDKNQFQYLPNGTKPRFFKKEKQDAQVFVVINFPTRSESRSSVTLEAELSNSERDRNSERRLRLAVDIIGHLKTHSNFGRVVLDTKERKLVLYSQNSKDKMHEFYLVDSDYADLYDYFKRVGVLSIDFDPELIRAWVKSEDYESLVLLLKSALTWKERGGVHSDSGDMSWKAHADPETVHYRVSSSTSLVRPQPVKFSNKSSLPVEKEVQLKKGEVEKTFEINTDSMMVISNFSHSKVLLAMGLAKTPIRKEDVPDNPVDQTAVGEPALIISAPKNVVFWGEDEWADLVKEQGVPPKDHEIEKRKKILAEKRKQIAGGLLYGKLPLNGALLVAYAQDTPRGFIRFQLVGKEKEEGDSSSYRNISLRVIGPEDIINSIRVEPSMLKDFDSRSESRDVESGQFLDQLGMTADEVREEIQRRGGLKAFHQHYKKEKKLGLMHAVGGYPGLIVGLGQQKYYWEDYIKPISHANMGVVRYIFKALGMGNNTIFEAALKATGHSLEELRKIPQGTLLPALAEAWEISEVEAKKKLLNLMQEKSWKLSELKKTVGEVVSFAGGKSFPNADLLWGVGLVDAPELDNDFKREIGARSQRFGGASIQIGESLGFSHKAAKDRYLKVIKMLEARAGKKITLEEGDALSAIGKTAEEVAADLKELNWKFSDLFKDERFKGDYSKIRWLLHSKGWGGFIKALKVEDQARNAIRQRHIDLAGIRFAVYASLGLARGDFEGLLKALGLDLSKVKIPNGNLLITFFPKMQKEEARQHVLGLLKASNWDFGNLLRELLKGHKSLSRLSYAALITGLDVLPEFRVLLQSNVVKERGKAWDRITRRFGMALDQASFDRTLEKIAPQLLKENHPSHPGNKGEPTVTSPIGRFKDAWLENFYKATKRIPYIEDPHVAFVFEKIREVFLAGEGPPTYLMEWLFDKHPNLKLDPLNEDVLTHFWSVWRDRSQEPEISAQILTVLNNLSHRFQIDPKRVRGESFEDVYRKKIEEFLALVKAVSETDDLSQKIQIYIQIDFVKWQIASMIERLSPDSLQGFTFIPGLLTELESLARARPYEEYAQTEATVLPILLNDLGEPSLESHPAEVFQDALLQIPYEKNFRVAYTFYELYELFQFLKSGKGDQLAVITRARLIISDLLRANEKLTSYFSDKILELFWRDAWQVPMNSESERWEAALKTLEDHFSVLPEVQLDSELRSRVSRVVTRLGFLLNRTLSLRSEEDSSASLRSFDYSVWEAEQFEALSVGDSPESWDNFFSATDKLRELARRRKKKRFGQRFKLLLPQLREIASQLKLRPDFEAVIRKVNSKSESRTEEKGELQILSKGKGGTQYIGDGRWIKVDYPLGDFTKLLLEGLLEEGALHPEMEVLDVGGGEGPIVMGIADRVKRAVMTEIYPYAVKKARENIRAQGLTNVEIYEGDLFEPVKGQKFDLIIANPPALPFPSRLKEAVDQVNPYLWFASNGGEKGREQIDRIIREFAPYLKENGKLWLVHHHMLGIDQTASLLETGGFQSKTIRSGRYILRNAGDRKNLMLKYRKEIERKTGISYKKKKGKNPYYYIDLQLLEITPIAKSESREPDTEASLDAYLERAYTAPEVVAPSARRSFLSRSESRSLADLEGVDRKTQVEMAAEVLAYEVTRIPAKEEDWEKVGEGYLLRMKDFINSFLLEYEVFVAPELDYRESEVNETIEKIDDWLRSHGLPDFIRFRLFIALMEAKPYLKGITMDWLGVLMLEFQKYAEYFLPPLGWTKGAYFADLLKRTTKNNFRVIFDPDYLLSESRDYSKGLRIYSFEGNEIPLNYDSFGKEEMDLFLRRLESQMLDEEPWFLAKLPWIFSTPLFIFSALWFKYRSSEQARLKRTNKTIKKFLKKHMLQTQSNIKESRPKEGGSEANRSESRTLPFASPLAGKQPLGKVNSVLIVAREMTNRILGASVVWFDQVLGIRMAFYFELFPELLAEEVPVMSETKQNKMAILYQNILVQGGAVVLSAPLVNGLSAKGKMAFLRPIYEGTQSLNIKKPLVYFADIQSAESLREALSGLDLFRKQARAHRIFKTVAQEPAEVANRQKGPVAVSLTTLPAQTALKQSIPALFLPSVQMNERSEPERVLYLHRLTMLQFLVAQELNGFKGEALQQKLTQLLNHLKIEFSKVDDYVVPSIQSLLSETLGTELKQYILTKQSA